MNTFYQTSVNVGFCTLPTKVASYTPFLSHLWINLAKTWFTFDPERGNKSSQMGLQGAPNSFLKAK